MIPPRTAARPVQSVGTTAEDTALLRLARVLNGELILAAPISPVLLSSLRRAGYVISSGNHITGLTRAGQRRVVELQARVSPRARFRGAIGFHR
ncbi:MAG: hypothetical protein C0467_15855 [Planctomycetaceae bacterium]|nr:hypothetical protein [Planctomycetaceae bacterium]